MLGLVTPARPRRIYEGTNYHALVVGSQDWVCEPKLDGARFFAGRTNGRLWLSSRHDRPWRRKLSPLAWQQLERLPDGMCVDGEYLGPNHIELFDIPTLNLVPVAFTLEERRALLEDLFPEVGAVRVLQRAPLRTPLAEARRRGWEGLVYKRRASSYPPGETTLWLKMKP